MLLNQKNYLLENNEIIMKISNFLYSNYYFLFLIGVIFICWVLKQFVLAIILLCLIASFILVLQKDMTPIMPITFMAVAGMSSTTLPPNFAYYMIILIIPISAVIFHLVYYKMDKIYFGKLWFSLLLVLIAGLLSGIGSRLPKNTTGTIVSAIVISLIPFLLYWLMINFAKIPEGKSIVDYMARAYVFFGLLIFMQLVVNYIQRWDAITSSQYSVPHLGWAISNSIAMALHIVFPMGFYLYLKSNSKYAIFYMLAGILEFACIIATTSRGGVIFGALELIAAGVVVLIKADKKKRKETLILVAIIAVFGIIAFVLGFNKIKKIFYMVFHDGMNDSGRLEIYREAIACFFEYPIFGAGLGYIGMNKNIIDGKGLYLFHNTILQIVGSMGIVGLLIYMYHYFVKFEILFEKPNLFSTFIFVMFIGFEGYSMLNTGTIQGYPYCAMVIFLIAAHEMEEKQEQSIAYSKIYEYLKSILNNRNKLSEDKV